MTTETKPSKRNARRWVLAGGLGALAGGALLANSWFNVFADASVEGALSVQDASGQAKGGAIYLVDIRRPDEWERTGIGRSAIPIDMRRDDFTAVLQSLFDKAGTRPVALICARGVRSKHLTARLANAGFVDIIDVPEGMLGSGAGPGWIASDLPLRMPTKDELEGRAVAQIEKS